MSNVATGFAAPALGVRGALLYPPTLLAIAVGTALRLGWVLTSAFPRTDGGLFWVMIRDLQANGYRLPAFTTYDGGVIPFVYPPFALLQAALLADVTGWSPLAIVRLEPAVVSSLALVAFAAFAFLLTADLRATWMSTLLFGVLPGPLRWQAAGGGLTRSFGCLFALLLLVALLRFYQRGRTRDLVLAAAAGALALASHLDWSMFAVYTSALLLPFYGRTRRSVVGTVLAGAAALSLAAVWWLPVLLRHGPTPFVAMLTGSSEVWPPGSGLLDLAFPAWGGEAAPVLSLLALAGFVIQLRRRSFFAPLLLLASYALQVRGHDQASAVPVALLAATTVSVFWTVGTQTVQSDRPRRPPTVAVRVGIVLICVLGTYTGLRLTRDIGFAAEFTPSHRAAFDWVQRETAPDATFLVVSTNTWEAGLEWFPALTERRSLTTATGYEPVPGEFSGRYFANAQLRRCSDEREVPSRSADGTDVPVSTEPDDGLGPPGSECVRRWFARWVEPEYLFVFKVRPAPSYRLCCPVLAEELRNDSYPVAFENDDVVIFRVVPFPHVPSAAAPGTLEDDTSMSDVVAFSEAALHSP